MTRPLLIAGGGIGGLTLAALLHRRGRACLVLERTAHLAPVGAGLVLQPNVLKSLRVCGLDGAIEPRGESMQRLQVRDDRGAMLSEIEGAAFRARFNAGIAAFHRATLHQALLDLIPTSLVRLDAGVRSYAASGSGVAVELESGEQVQGEALVAADGLHSAVRRQMLNDGEPRYAGYTSWRGVTARESLWPAGQMCESWGRGARFGLVAIDGDRLYWFATANTAPGGREAGKEALLRRFAEWHDPIPRVIEATPDDAILRTDISDREPATRWSEGRVTLLGDAAHPMTPNLGQGGGQAMEDAVALDQALAAEADCAKAFMSYESRRRARTARVVEESRRFGRIGQIENSLARALRDFAVRVTPLPMTFRSLAWLYEPEA